jgi:hypothetical protein
MLTKLKQLYRHKNTPRLFYKKYDGGKESGVVGYFLIEWKSVFSIGLLRFSEGSRESYHSHAFLAITWWLTGKVEEETYKGIYKTFSPSIKPKITKRDKVHRVKGLKKTWALTIRGNWVDEWFEVTPDDKVIKLTHGRKVL